MQDAKLDSHHWLQSITMIIVEPFGTENPCLKPSCDKESSKHINVYRYGHFDCQKLRNEAVWAIPLYGGLIPKKVYLYEKSLNHN